MIINMVITHARTNARTHARTPQSTDYSERRTGTSRKGIQRKKRSLTTQIMIVSTKCVM